MGLLTNCMNFDTPEEHAEDLYNRLTDEVDVEQESVEESLVTFYEYDVAPDSAEEMVLRNLSKENNMSQAALLGEDTDDEEMFNVEDIEGADEWYNLTVKVIQIWDNDNDSIDQVGLVADETDVIKFTKWESAEIDEDFAEGETYKLSSVVTNEYDGRMQIQLNSATTVEPVAVDIEPPEQDNDSEQDTDEVLNGSLVSVLSGSGLIQRCSAEGCTRTLHNSECPDHGDVDGEFDLRIKGVLDDGHETHTVFINDLDEIEKLTGMSLDDAEEMAKSELNTDVVEEKFSDDLALSYLTVHGYKWDTGDDEYFMVDEVEEPDVEFHKGNASGILARFEQVIEQADDTKSTPVNEGEKL